MKLIIDGGHRLSGQVQVNGAKNSVLPILAATLINGGENILHNCPDLKDVDSAVDILRHLGCTVKREGKTIVVDSTNIRRFDVPDNLMREMRSSVIFLGPILARCGESQMSFPGGCELGPRPIDLHIDAIRKLGGKVTEQSGVISCKAEKMVGRDIVLSFPSVGATENIMLLATSCLGRTRIKNAAQEPEIDDLICFLNKAGGHIIKNGSEIEVIGTQTNQPTEHSIMPDRIETATYLCMGAAAGGQVKISGAVPAHVETITEALSQAGCKIKVSKDTITLVRDISLTSIRPVRTMPYPGFPTDAQSPLMAALLCAKGSTIFLETIFENRYRQVNELMRMGADIRVAGRVAVVSGVPDLYGTRVRCTDLRGGAALAVAAMGAVGRTEIDDVFHIDRGYEHLENAINALGGKAYRTEN